MGSLLYNLDVDDVMVIICLGWEIGCWLWLMGVWFCGVEGVFLVFWKWYCWGILFFEWFVGIRVFLDEFLVNYFLIEVKIVYWDFWVLGFKL